MEALTVLVFVGLLVASVYFISQRLMNRGGGAEARAAARAQIENNWERWLDSPTGVMHAIVQMQELRRNGRLEEAIALGLDVKRQEEYRSDPKNSDPRNNQDRAYRIRRSAQRQGGLLGDLLLLLAEIMMDAAGESKNGDLAKEACDVAGQGMEWLKKLLDSSRPSSDRGLEQDPILLRGKAKRASDVCQASERLLREISGDA